MRCRPSTLVQAICVALCVCCVTGAMAQIQLKKPKDELGMPGPDRFEIYAGYDYIHPSNSDINNYKYQTAWNAPVVSMTGFFTKHIGFQVEGEYFNGPNSTALAALCAANGVNCAVRTPKYYLAEAGPVYRFQYGRLVPFVHALGGGAKIAGPVNQPLTWGWAVTGGVGVDYILPFWKNRLAVRPIQADFHYSQATYGPLVLPKGVSGGFGEIYAYKLSGGLVLRMGSMATYLPVQLGCPVSPAVIYPGDPLTVMAQPLNLDPHHKSTYTWKTTGGKLTAGEQGANIDTAGLPPGDYMVTGHVQQGRKLTEQASCQGAFTVRNYDPPTIGCTATPSTMLSGTSVTVASNGMSPQNRQLTYTYSSTAGQIVGSGSTAQLSTAGVPPGTINITCSLVDDLGKSATASTSVTITAPPPAQLAASLPESRSLCSVSFERDRARPVRVDNEAKACLDDIALTLNHDPEAKVVVVGRYSADEGQQQGEERSVNVQQYLLQKGVEGSRIDLRVGDASGRTVESTLLPTGATYTDAGQEFDVTTVHPPTYASAQRYYGGSRRVVRRRATRHRVVTRHRTTRRRRR